MYNDPVQMKPETNFRGAKILFHKGLEWIFFFLGGGATHRKVPKPHCSFFSELDGGLRQPGGAPPHPCARPFAVLWLP